MYIISQNKTFYNVKSKNTDMSVFRQMLLGKARVSRIYDYSKVIVNSTTKTIPASGVATEIVLEITIPYTIYGDSTKYTLSNYTIHDGDLLPDELDPTNSVSIIGKVRNALYNFAIGSSDTDSDGSYDTLYVSCDSLGTTLTNATRRVGLIDYTLCFGINVTTCTVVYYQEKNDIVSCSDITDSGIKRILLSAGETTLTVPASSLTITNPIYSSGATAATATVAAAECYSMGYVTGGVVRRTSDTPYTSLDLYSNEACTTLTTFPLTSQAYCNIGTNNTSEERIYTVTLTYSIGGISKVISDTYTQENGGSTGTIDTPTAGAEISVWPQTTTVNANAGSMSFAVIAYNCTWSVKLTSPDTTSTWLTMAGNGSTVSLGSGGTITGTTGSEATNYTFTINYTKNNSNTRRFMVTVSNGANSSTDSRSFTQTGKTITPIT